MPAFLSLTSWLSNSREPTAFESITSTLQSFSLSAFSSPFRQSNHASTPFQIPSDHLSGPHQPCPRSYPPSSSPHSLTSDHQVILSQWHTYQNHSLLLLLTRHGFTVWDVRDLEALVQLCSFPFDQINRSNRHASSQAPNTRNLAGQRLPIPSSAWDTPQPLQLHHFEPISASVLPIQSLDEDLYVAVLSASTSQRLSKLEIFSTKAACLVTYMDIPGIGIQLKLNSNIVVVATKAPLALHLFTMDACSEALSPNGEPQVSLNELPFSPILDLTPKPKSGEPVFCLGQNRVLAYASNKAPHEREPPIATRHGFTFATTHQELRSPSKTGSFGSMGSSFGTGETVGSVGQSAGHHNSNGGMWRNSVSNNLDTIDETARKVGGGLLSGAKLLTSWGHQVLMSGHSSGRPIADSKHHHQTCRTEGQPKFSKSAPLPYLTKAHEATHPHGFGRELASPNHSDSPDDSIYSSGIGMYRAHPEGQTSQHDLRASGSTLHAETSISSGNVKVIDLLAPSTANAHRRNYQPISHFKISTDPLLFLSFNPSSNMLLTSSIDAHSFNVFELRPYSRVGKSCLNGRGPSLNGKDRQATVWHRYKLVRGFTSADVRDVIWAWDSKIVAVVTDRGTHRKCIQQREPLDRPISCGSSSLCLSIFTLSCIVDLFAIHPAGGHYQLTGENPQFRQPVSPVSPALFNLATANPLVFQPLSVTISSFTTIKPKHFLRAQYTSNAPHQPLTSPNPIPVANASCAVGHVEQNTDLESSVPGHTQTSFTFLQPLGDLLTYDPPTSLRQDFEHILNPSHKRLPSGLLFDHATHSVILYNLDVKKKSLNPVTNSMASASGKASVPRTTSLPNTHKAPGTLDTTHRKTTAPSGLSQQMQQKQPYQINSNVVPGSDTQHLGATSSVTCTATVSWALNAPKHRGSPARFYLPSSSTQGVLLVSSDPSDQPPLLANTHVVEKWTSFVELDTFSHSIHILPRSIYTCHQFDFLHLARPKINPFMPSSPASNLLHHLARADLQQLRRKKVFVRQEVLIKPGDLADGSPSSDIMHTVELEGNFVNRAPKLGSPTRMRYAEPIRSAVETVLDARPTVFSPESPSHLAPGFPNGQPGKRGGGGHALAAMAHNVGPVVGVVNERVRRELGRLGARRTSTGVMMGPTSVSFDDAEDVTLDRARSTSSLSSFASDASDGERRTGGWDAWAIEEDEVVDLKAGGGTSGGSTEAFSTTTASSVSSGAAVGKKGPKKRGKVKGK